MIGLVTDSNSQLPESLRRRYGVKVVPFTVVVDGRPFREGVDISSGEFYAAVRAGAEVSTAAPSPGELAAAYQALADDGAEAVLSVHIGSSVSGTVNAARIAAEGCGVPVEIVDTGTASFGVGCCLWAAGEALARGAALGEAAAAARRVAARVGNVFVVGALDLARRGGRLATGVDTAAGSAEKDVPVLALVEGAMEPVGRAGNREEAVAVMLDHLAARTVDGPLKVGVGHAELPQVAEDLAGRVAALDGVEEVVRYGVGPSVGVHTGPGTVGAFFFPAAAVGSAS